MKTKALLVVAGLTAGLLLGSSSTAEANVYATNIKINGSQTGTVGVGQGSSATITYTLNEAATAGVKIEILSGQTVVRTITVASGSGTTKGSNSVVWNGKNDGGVNVPMGSYSVKVTAAATGYADWTQISDDAAPGNYINRPRGIAVNANANSPYYGRIFVGNCNRGPGYSTNGWGDVPGIYKFNADGSYSDDGAGRYGTAGYNFVDGNYYDATDNPLDMKVREDDRLYWNNWVQKCEIVACDMLLTTNQLVMPEGYYVNNPYGLPYGWQSFEVTDVLTDHPRVYLCDANYPSGGAWFWPMTNGAVDVNDPSGSYGYQAVQTGGTVTLKLDAMAIDAKTNVYVLQNRANAGDVNMRAACWTNWDGSTPLLTDAAWVVGSADDTFRNSRYMALDSYQNPHYLAVGLYTLATNIYSANVPWAGIKILNTADGSTVVSNLSALATYHGVAWDGVGNLYGGSQSASKWRIFSPPGANQAVTPALATIQVTEPVLPPQISTISVTGGNAVIRFTGSTSDTAAQFTLESAASLPGTFGTAAGANITQVSPGVFQATAPVSGPTGFYRIKK